MKLPKTFIGQLNQSAVLTTLYNMIIGQEVFSDNIKLKGTLVERFRIDGTMYGDTKLFISTDIGTLYDFPNTTNNLLTKTPPVNPAVQAVEIDTFKQTAVTIDGVKLKQAFQSADIYGAFVSVIVQWLRDTYKVLNVTLINTFIGTVVTSATRNTEEVELPTLPNDADFVETRQYNSLVGEEIGASIANLIVDLEDVSRDFNDNKFLRAISAGDMMVVWNSKWMNKIKHISLPQIFHKDDVIGLDLTKHFINSRFFGDIVTTAGTSTGVERLTRDRVVTVGTKEVQLFPGDILPTGETYVAREVYTVNENIICKLVHKRAVPFMSAMLTETEFYNPKDLDRNHYLTWGYSDPTYLSERPIITVKAAY